MSEEVKRLTIDKDNARVKSQFSYHEGFADACNEVLDKVNEEYPDLHFTFDPKFLLDMIHGKIKTNYSRFDGSRYKRILDEQESLAIFSDIAKGARLKVENLVQLAELPEASEELKNLFSRIYNAKESIGLNLAYIEVRGDRIIFTEKAKTIIERENSTVIYGEDVDTWEEAKALADQLNKFCEKYHGQGLKPSLDYLFHYSRNHTRPK